MKILAYSQGKLWFIECVYLGVQIRPVFADSVTTLKLFHNSHTPSIGIRSY